MTERRFTESEVAEIFERATSATHTGQQQHVPTGEGMTLAEIQDIGREVGIAPSAITDAARMIGQTGQQVSRNFFGLPMGVGRTVELERKLTDDEWERLVVDLRETFDARGSVRQDGSLRQWTNGNLQVLLEPTAAGHRVRLRTVKGDARAYMIGGMAMLGVATVSLISAAITGVAPTDPGLVGSFGFLGAMGAAMFAAGALRLPRWARTRRQQMEEIAGRLTLAAKSLPSSSSEKP